MREVIIAVILMFAAILGLGPLLGGNDAANPKDGANNQLKPQATLNTSTGAAPVPFLDVVGLDMRFINQEYRWFVADKIKKAFFLQFGILDPKGRDPYEAARLFAIQAVASKDKLVLVGPYSSTGYWYIAGHPAFFAAFGNVTLNEILQSVAQGNGPITTGHYFLEPETPMYQDDTVILYKIRRG